jgi:hypothetical protein
MENIFFSWTAPHEEWILGIEHSPDNIVTDLSTGVEKEFRVITIGLLFFRFDILINKKQVNGN